MTRYLKTLGLALIAVFVLSALAASAASAGKLTLSAYPGVIEGIQTGEANKVVLEGGRSVECNEVVYKGEYKESEVAEEMYSVSPEFKGCTATILGNVTPTTTTVNGCTTTFSVGTVTDATNATGQAHLRCPAGKKMETHVWKNSTDHLANVTPFCTYTTGEQTLGTAGSIKYQIDSTHKKLTISGSGLSVKKERSGGTLVNCGAASQTASLSFQATVTAKKGGVEQTITFS